MTEDVELVSIISPDMLVDSIHSLLTARGYAVLNYGSIENAEKSPIFFTSHVVVVDIGRNLAPHASFINKLAEQAPKTRLILVGDCVQLVYASEIPNVFHCLIRPFAPEKLAHVVEQALITEFPFEKRRELRLPAGMIVEMFHKANAYRTFTQNLSFHGMQVVWQDMASAAAIHAEFSQGHQPIAGCRIRLQAPSTEAAEHLNLPLRLRYINQSRKTDGLVVMGFEFGDLDLDLRSKICSIVAG